MTHHGPMTSGNRGEASRRMSTSESDETARGEPDDNQRLAELLAGAEYDLVQARESVTSGLLNEGGADRDDLDRLAETIEVMERLRKRAETTCR